MANANSKTQRVRVGGSGFTVFTFGGQPITFCQQISHTSPSFVGQGASLIQPMDEPYGTQIITPIAAGMGTLTLNLFELWGDSSAGSRVWDRLGATIGGSFASGNPSFGANNPYIGNSGPVNVAGPHFNGLGDIVDIAIQQAQMDPSLMQIVKYIRPLPTTSKTTFTPYFETYHNCAITDVVDGEQIEVGTLEVIKQITVNYTYYTRAGKSPLAFSLYSNPGVLAK
jgi:hypothetical protein